SSKFITYRKSVELIKKLENLAGSHDAKKLQRQVYVANRVKTMNESIYYSVDSINSAISENVRIKFKYFDWDENKKRKLRYNGKEYRVSPWALVWNDENYYMVAYDTEKGIIKHYRVDKMLNISLDKEKRDGEKMFENFDVALYSRTMFGMFGGEEETVSLRCRNTKANVIIDRFGKDVTFFKDDDEHFIVNVKVSVSPVFLTWIMNFGSDIKIVSPQSVIRELKALAKDVLCQYE
ncbi:MAG: helix-turn-helix transcriptional regulator, partial [Eubacteriales bacterium]